MDTAEDTKWHLNRLLQVPCIGGAGIRTQVQTCRPMTSTCVVTDLYFGYRSVQWRTYWYPILLAFPREPQSFSQVSPCFYRCQALKSGSNLACNQAARASTASSETNSSSFLADNFFASFKSWRSARSHRPSLPPVETNTPPFQGTFHYTHSCYFWQLNRHISFVWEACPATCPKWRTPARDRRRAGLPRHPAWSVAH